MAIKTGLVLCTLLLGSLAVPVPENDLSEFFPETRQERIVGGALAPQNSHPWMVAIFSGTFVNFLTCGGSVITERTTLTAAHCIFPILNNGNLIPSARVTVGTNTWRTGGQVYTLSGYTTHADYNPNLIKNDIGVLYTTNNIQYSNNVRAIPLAFDYAGGGILSRVAGWGALVGGGAAQNQLRQVDLTTIDGNQCVTDVQVASVALNMVAPPVDPAVEVCTFRAAGVGTCQGDSGSALVRLDRSEQIGVVSWGFPCARGAPDMFVRVSAFQPWINNYSL